VLGKRTKGKSAVNRFAPLGIALVLVVGIAVTAQIVGPLAYINESNSMPHAFDLKIQTKDLLGGWNLHQGNPTSVDRPAWPKVCVATAPHQTVTSVCEGVLRPNPGGGRSASYDLVWETPPIS